MRFRLLVIAVFLGGAWFIQPLHAESLVAATGQTVAGHEFRAVGAIASVSSGEVIFTAFLADGQQGLFRYSAGRLSPVVTTADL